MSETKSTAEVRIDKWLWAVRIFKTRTLASDACKKNRVSVNGVQIKPSRMVKVGDKIDVRKPPVTFTFKVLALSDKRMGAKLVPDFMENLTPPETYEMLRMNYTSDGVRDKGTGRPTKKDRRDLDTFSEDIMSFDDFDWE